MIDATPEQKRIVLEALKSRVPGVEVRAYGSRINGKAKTYSDLDLVVMAPKRMELVALGELREAFAESDLPFRVEVQDWNAISGEFRKIIEQKYEIVQNAAQ